MIDLHLHTTASDGRSSARDLVAAARRARLATISVTDHDTVAALQEAQAACAVEGLEWVPGIEISAVRGASEVHVLGYFIDPTHPPLLAFLEAQRADRVRRVREMVRMLLELGVPVDEAALFDSAVFHGARSVGRPAIASAMVRAGHVQTAREAFDLYLGEGRAAFVARRAPTPEEVFATVHDAGGIASLAHPALLGHDDWIPGMAAHGLDALEAFYAEHDAETTARYRDLATRLGLAVSGGSDFHGDVGHGPQHPGDMVLPPDEFERLKDRARGRGRGVLR